MEEIFSRMNISKDTINQMIEMCPNIKELSKDEILNKIAILNKIGCNAMQIRDIISSNPRYLDRLDSDIDKLVKKLKEFGFTRLELLFDGNPYILNLDDFEIENYIKNREANGEKQEDIVDEMEANPILFEKI